jgi:hypothetical protein
MKTWLTLKRLQRNAHRFAALARWAEWQREAVERAKDPGLTSGEVREFVCGLLALERVGERLAQLMGEVSNRRTGGGPPAAA